MELRHLKYFLAVAARENMRRAAGELGIAQPALSRQIADLEREMGVQLFERLPRGLRLSPGGMAFQIEAQKIMDDMGTAVSAARRAARGEAGSLQIGFVDAASWRGAFPKSVHRYRSQFPKVSLHLLPMASAEQLSRIGCGDLDGGFCYSFETIPSECENMPLRFDKMLLGVPQTYRWGKRRDLRLKDLSDEPFIWYRRSDAPRFHDALLQTITAAGLPMQIVQEVTNGTSMLSLISAGIGLGFVNSALTDRKPRHVALLPVRDLSLDLPLVFVWRKDNNAATLKRYIHLLQTIVGLVQP
ncbi:LysR family transcriptional regulator [Granulicella aggregans]|uniref:LysR family transcriptional regulator n=1 Tax=Granulicella aggregans TaxID=474949 RepID=UPI001C85E333